MFTRPYHETLPELIHSVGTNDSIASLATFIIGTTLPGNFDEVEKEWRSLLNDLCLTDAEYCVLVFIAEQRRLAEEKAKNPERRRSEVFDFGRGDGC